MSELRAHKRQKNDIIHIFDGENTRKIFPSDNEIEVFVCGSCDRTDTTKEVSKEKITNNEYFIVDGEIIGKFCGNCKRVIENRDEEEYNAES